MIFMFIPKMIQKLEFDSDDPGSEISTSHYGERNFNPGLFSFQIIQNKYIE